MDGIERGEKIMHGFANPRKFLGLARRLTPILLVIGVVVSLGAVLWGLLMVPPDRLMGETVRIIFIHVPSAWLGMAGWMTIAGSSLAFLVWRHPLAALAARAAAIPGLVFTALCLATGSIWGRPTWGTWWVWDGRLTSMLILLFLYLAYIALSQAVDREGASARLPAIFGLVGAVNIPIINRSVVWWNSLHQPPSTTLSGSTIDGVFLWPMLIALLGFTCLFAACTLMNMRALLAEAQTEARLRRRALEAEPAE